MIRRVADRFLAKVRFVLVLAAGATFGAGLAFIAPSSKPVAAIVNSFPCFALACLAAAVALRLRVVHRARASRRSMGRD